MLRSLFCVFIPLIIHSVAGHSQLCGNLTNNILSCTTQILGDDGSMDSDLCTMKVFPPNSAQCNTMSFSHLVSNTQIGGVTLKPHIITVVHNEGTRPFAINHTVLNITFSNIKWTEMQFRFQNKYRISNNHCRNIKISKDVAVNDQTVLYYDCYWPLTDDRDGRSYILDFEATNDWSIYRGQYYFNIPSAEMLSKAVKEKEWKPFTYIEIFQTKMRLHIMPPPSHLKITGYDVKVMKECGTDGIGKVESNIVDLWNITDEVTYDYNYVGANGFYYFVVTPLHVKCPKGAPILPAGCKSVESPKINIMSEPRSLNICIASVTALIVATLFAYYVALRVIRKYWCKDYKLAMGHEIPTPPKVLVVYSASNRLHAECVRALVAYLRAEYGLELMYDGDIAATAHGDPYLWAEGAFSAASHLLYVAGPAPHPAPQPAPRGTYDRPLASAHRDVDALLLSFVRADRAAKRPKDVMNVFFEHSSGRLPVETRHEKAFFLMNDWQKLISHLSKNLLPKKLIARTEKGRCFLEHLSRANELLAEKRDDVVIRCEKSMFEKKVLL